MQKLFTICLFLFSFLLYAQKSTQPNLICNQGNNQDIIGTFKDENNNEYLVYTIDIERDSNGIIKLQKVILQKYDEQDKSVFSDCGLTFFIANAINIQSLIKIDNDQNIVIFLNVLIEVTNGQGYYNLIGFKFDKNGNSLWGKNGISFSERELMCDLKNVELTKSGNIHLLRTYDVLLGETTASGTINLGYYMNINSNGVVQNAQFIQDSTDYNFFPTYKVQKTYILHKSSQDTVTISHVSFREINTYNLQTLVFNDQGFISESNIENLRDSIGVVCFYNLENELYYIRQVNNKYLLYKNNRGVFDLIPTLTLDNNPLVLVKKGTNFYYYYTITGETYSEGAKFIQKVDIFGNKLFQVKINDFTPLIGDFNNIQIMPTDDNRLRILHETQIIDEFGAYKGFIYYQNIDVAGNIQYKPLGIEVYKNCVEYDTQYLSKSFVDSKDLSLNIYFTSDQVFNAGGTRKVLRWDFHSIPQDFTICTPIKIKRTK